MTQSLNDAQDSERLAGLPGWTVEGGTIRKTYEFSAYLAGVAFAAAVGVVCEGLNHHPDMTIGWRKVTVSFTTHDAGSTLTEKDYTAAAAVESLGYPRPQ